MGPHGGKLNSPTSLLVVSKTMSWPRTLPPSMPPSSCQWATTTAPSIGFLEVASITRALIGCAEYSVAALSLGTTSASEHTTATSVLVSTFLHRTQSPHAIRVTAEVNEEVPIF